MTRRSKLKIMLTDRWLETTGNNSDKKLCRIRAEIILSGSLRTSCSLKKWILLTVVSVLKRFRLQLRQGKLLILILLCSNVSVRSICATIASRTGGQVKFRYNSFLDRRKYKYRLNVQASTRQIVNESLRKRKLTKW